LFGRESYASTDSVSNDVCRARLCLGKCMSSRIADCIDMSEDGEDGGDVLMLECDDVEDRGGKSDNCGRVSKIL